MKTSEKINRWLDILAEVSVFLEDNITCEEDKKRIKNLDLVLDDLYNINKVLVGGNK